MANSFPESSDILKFVFGGGEGRVRHVIVDLIFGFSASILLYTHYCCCGDGAISAGPERSR